MCCANNTGRNIHWHWSYGDTGCAPHMTDPGHAQKQVTWELPSTLHLGQLACFPPSFPWEEHPYMVCRQRSSWTSSYIRSVCLHTHPHSAQCYTDTILGLQKNPNPNKPNAPQLGCGLYCYVQPRWDSQVLCRCSFFKWWSKHFNTILDRQM